MRSLRIVITALHYHLDNPSGAARLALDEAEYLASLGHGVWLVTQDLSSSKPEKVSRAGLHVLRYPASQLRAFDPRRMWVHQERTRDILSRHVGSDVDLVRGHALLSYDGAVSLYGASAKSCYAVHSPVRLEMQASSRGATMLKRIYFSINARLTHRIERRCLEVSNCVTCDSNYTRSLIGQLHGAEIQQKVKVIPGWVDFEKFQIIPDRQEAKTRLGWSTDQPVFFTLRRLVPRMGLDRLLYALRQVRSAGWKFHLVIGGSGPLRNKLETLVRELDLQECVCFAGFVPEDVLPLMYAAADAFVLPTVELECFGLIALEALACGRPVLATPVGAIPEVVGRVEKGWLAQDASADAIAQLLLSFLTDTLPMHSPEQLRATVLQHYSRERVLKQLVAVAFGTTDYD